MGLNGHIIGKGES